MSKIDLQLRRAHRWLGIAAALLFVSVATTGVALQVQQLFGAKEQEKERLAELASPASLGARLVIDQSALNHARLALLQRVGNRPIDSVDWQIKGPMQRFTFHLGGANPVKAELELPSARIAAVEAGGESWLLRLHTGEIVGDGGKVLGLFWGIALLAMLMTGIAIYLQLYGARQRTSKARTSWRRFFWVVLAALLPTAMTGLSQADAERDAPSVHDRSANPPGSRFVAAPSSQEVA